MPYKIIQTECTCLQCGTDIRYGRYDRKFCSDKCRNKYHNMRRSQFRNSRLRVLTSLENNYNILEHLLSIGCHSVDKLDLIDMGFNCNAVTSFVRKARTFECRCFDIRYIDRTSRFTDIQYTSALEEE